MQNYICKPMYANDCIYRITQLMVIGDTCENGQILHYVKTRTSAYNIESLYLL